MGIKIELEKDIVWGATKGDGHVTIYSSFPHKLGINEVKRFVTAMHDAIELATRWQEGNVYARPRADPEPELSDLRPSVVKKRAGRPRRSVNPENAARAKGIARNGALSTVDSTQSEAKEDVEA